MIEGTSVTRTIVTFAVAIWASSAFGNSISQESTKERLANADSLNNLAAAYEAMKSYALAEPLYQEALAIRKDVLGNEHPDYAKSLNNLAVLYENMGEFYQFELDQDFYDWGGFDDNDPDDLFAKAESFYQNALTIRKAVLGEDHPDYVAGLNDLAGLYVTLGEYQKAAQLLRQTLDTDQDRFGDDLSEYVKNLYDVASFTNFSRSERFLLKALEIVEDVRGVDNPDYTTLSRKLGELYVERGYFAKAMPLFQAVIDIVKTVPITRESEPNWENFLTETRLLGNNAFDHSEILNSIYWLYIHMGDYAQAERCLLMAAEVDRDIFGEDNPSYAASLRTIAGHYALMGDYVHAERVHVKALKIVKAILGENDREYAIHLRRLASFYSSWGDIESRYYEKAESLLTLAMEIDKATIGVQNLEYAGHLTDLGHLYELMGKYDQAELVLLSALKTIKSTLGQRSNKYSITLMELAFLYRSMDNHKNAEPLLQQALAIDKAIYGEKDLQFANSLFYAGQQLASIGSYDQAEPLLQQALAIGKRTLGENHPTHSYWLNTLANVYMHMASYAKADTLYKHLLNITREVVDRTALVQSERQQLAMGAKERNRLDAYLSLTLHTGSKSKAAFAQILRWKGATILRQRQYRQASSDPAVAEVFAHLRTVTRQLASLARAYPKQEDSVANWRDRVSALNADRERLEAELSQKSVAFRQAHHEVTVAEVAAALPEQTVLVDFLEFNKWMPYPSREKTRSLIASVLRPDGEVRVIDLGPSDAVAQAIDTWRQCNGISADGKAAGRLLRQRLWEPLLPLLDTAKTVLISLDGTLGRLPIGALPGAKPDTYLLEDYALAFLPVPQMLPQLTSKRELGGNLLLVGGVDYDRRQSESVAANESAVKSDPLRVAQVRGGTHFGPLHATLPEVTRVGDLFQEAFKPPTQAIVLLRKAAATEEQFRTLAPGFDFLHLATHGFFAPPKQQPFQAQVYAMRARRSAVYGDEARVVHGTDPGLLSGLVFSGANQPPDAEFDDGILTATEIAMLPLGKVDMAVLSACETGLGESAGGEGLLGVQRAFQVAGVRSTVASLWKVPDYETRLLMESFYRNLWEKEMSKLHALREAQLWMLRNSKTQKSQLEERGLDPASTKADHTANRSSPFYWAAFQLSGDWR